VALEAWECWVIYRSDFWLCGGKALVSQGVEEVSLQGWILDGMSGGFAALFPPPIKC